MIAGYPPPLGLYDPRDEHDACGVGFIADTLGRRSHGLLRDALTGLGNLTHRGAVSADGLSGDGAGVLTQLPRALFEDVRDPAGTPLGRDDALAVGMLFLPRAPEALSASVSMVAAHCAAARVRLLSWRTVPVDESVLGGRARDLRPEIRQVFLRRPDGLDDVAFERRLYLIWRRLEREARERRLAGFHVASLSTRTIVYKGLMVAPQLDAFYPDLRDERFATGLAVFHQRFSTNTFPTWALAQPLHFLAHNGEINTLRGNHNRFRSSVPTMASPVWGDAIGELFPLLGAGESDSMALDKVFGLLHVSGRDPLHAMMMLLPEAYQGHRDLDPEIAAFYEYHAALMAPWDGPAAVAFTDGRIVAAMLDRNGLRPLRYWRTCDDRVIAASEAGVVPVDPAHIVESGRLGPSGILAVDTTTGRVLRDAEIKRSHAQRRPYRRWLDEHLRRPPAPVDGAGQTPEWPAEDLTRRQKAFAYGQEDLDRFLVPMMYEGREPVGSMGDDTPLALLSAHPKTIYRYFKQRFAQVTNPPIDPIRERLAMSLRVAVGPRANLLEESERAAELLKFPSPLLTTDQFDWLLAQDDPRLRVAQLDCTFVVGDGPEALAPAVEHVCAAAEAAVDSGASILVLSDRAVDAAHAAIPMLLATSAVNTHLMQTGKRPRCSLVCDTGDPRMDHHFACLIGYSAALVHPYIALATLRGLAAEDPRGTQLSLQQAVANYRRSIETGLLKIMSKMGISTLSGYRAAQNFEALGIAQPLLERWFPETVGRVGCVGIRELAVDVLRFHAEGYGQDPALQDRGIYRFRSGGEHHANNPMVTKVLHRAVRKHDAGGYREYVELIERSTPTHVRDLLRWKPAEQPLPLELVEPAEQIAQRFCTQAMSHGAISREAHEILAVAMNRLGGKSNSGEGGEAPERFRPYAPTTLPVSQAPWRPAPGDWGNSAIKQIASGRFGVTPDYLVSARELEIKMAQGSKPGEGGQIPGFKVTDEIAGLRRSAPGVMLISPPPHHDIYSIEDLGQLIHDLKRVNRAARVGVKLVSVSGIGTIAAGVAKAYADSIQVSGHEGGTGASPLASIKHAGMPWELGLAEVQQVLVLNDLRGRVTLRVDGGLRTGRDVVIGALLGADEFGFGTAALVAAGCVMVRRCHLNDCPVGIATQRPELRSKFPGQPEHVVAMMLFVAEHVRMILAEIGVPRLEDIIGRVDLLAQRDDVASLKGPAVDLGAILTDVDPGGTRPRRRLQQRNDRPGMDAPGLEDEVLATCEPALAHAAPATGRFAVTNRVRSLGARLAGELVRRQPDRVLSPQTVRLTFEGCAGQSFGAFCTHGISLTLVGQAQDYVGKGMHGGRIVIRPDLPAHARARPPVVMGNTVLYGATGGILLAGGAAGERLGVRNSGGIAVVAGSGRHCCEYMTGGCVVVPGGTGRNFGAGMTGGVAYVRAPVDDLARRINADFVELATLEPEDAALLTRLLQLYTEHTGATTGEPAEFTAVWPRDRDDRDHIRNEVHAALAREFGGPQPVPTSTDATGAKGAPS